MQRDHPSSPSIGSAELEAALRQWIGRDESNRRLAEAVLGAIARALDSAGDVGPDPSGQGLAKDEPVPSTPPVAEDRAAPEARGDAPPPNTTPPVLAVPAPALIRGPMVSPEVAARILSQGPLVRGQQTTAASVGEAREVDLSRIERRARVKADACSFAEKRQRHVAAGGSIYELRNEYEEIMGRAQSVEPCFLWMLRSGAEDQFDEGLLERARGWYRCVAAAAEFVRGLGDEPPKESLELLAEAQSGLYATLQEVPLEDRDVQVPVYQHVRDQGQRRRLYFERHLSQSEAADPETWSQAIGRVDAARQAAERRKAARKAIETALNDARWQVKKLLQAAGDPNERERIWRKLADACERASKGGEDAAGRLGEILEPVAPHTHEIPGDFPPESPIRRTLAALLEDGLDDVPGGAAPAWRSRPTPELARVRAALRGTTMVLVGGVEKPAARDALREAFELKAVEWLAIGEHKSLDLLTAPVLREETSIVIVMLRWSSHSYSELREVARQHGKMFVQLKGGYNPLRVAHEVCEQLGESLNG